MSKTVDVKDLPNLRTVCLCGGQLEHYDPAPDYSAMVCQKCSFHWTGKTTMGLLRDTVEWHSHSDTPLDLRTLPGFRLMFPDAQIVTDSHDTVFVHPRYSNAAMDYLKTLKDYVFQGKRGAYLHDDWIVLVVKTE